ncbi:hypothetical protein COLO4_28260 [Corchorus olitorius]|uniref:Uncharacterized protein n=1 Tax=Corchorus olitorius TaxID=93759 RepID=A0A1R3HMA4_9ROSI|nr:hypothetical protein COLO4_28260 [Corchorus olitorius]
MAPVLEGCELAQNRLKNPFRLGSIGNNTS